MLEGWGTFYGRCAVTSKTYLYLNFTDQSLSDKHAFRLFFLLIRFNVCDMILLMQIQPRAAELTLTAG